MTDSQAVLAILSTVITGVMGMLGLWVRDTLKQQRLYIGQLNARVMTLERREQEREKRIEHLEADNKLLRFRLGKALDELAKSNPALAKALDETGKFKVG